MLIEQQLLNRYKKYDHLNSDVQNSLVKILVSYIKPSFLFKSNILTPIQLGKVVEKENSKDGAPSEENLNWLHENCVLNDDFEGGISEYNRRIGFFTGSYWSWKNYGKLGNPKYFGNFGYRKLLDASALDNLSDYEMIVPKQEHLTCTIGEQLVKFHGKSMIIAIEEAIKNIYPEEVEDVRNYFATQDGYFHELYILNKNLFFDYCAWLWPLIQFWLAFDFEKYNEQDHTVSQHYFATVEEKRDVAFLIERITGYYLYKLTQKHYKYKEVEVHKFISKEFMSNFKKNVLSSIRNKLKKEVSE